MNKLYLTALSLLCCASSFATNFKGIISTHTTWTKANSPYILDGDVLIDTLASLTIEPGVEIQCAYNVEIFVDGSLTAIGTPSDPIKFTSNLNTPHSASWDGFVVRQYYNNIDSFVLKHCVVEYSAFGVNLGSYGNVSITHSKLLHNTYYSVHGYARTLALENNIVSDGSGVQVTILHQGKIADNEIFNCESGIITWGNGNGYLEIRNNRIDSCDGAGLSVSAKNTVIEDNIVTRCGLGLALAELHHPIKRNVFAYNSTGISLGADSKVTFVNNTLRYNKTGIYIGQEYKNTATIVNNCIDSSSAYLVYNNAYTNLTIAGNYFGLTDSAAIKSKIYDRFVDFNKSEVFITPFLTQAHQSCKVVGKLDTGRQTTIIKEPVQRSTVVIYPNPFVNSFRLSTEGKQINTVYVYNLLGVKLEALTDVETDVAEIDLGQYPAGLYVYKVSFADGSESTGRIQKQ